MTLRLGLNKIKKECSSYHKFFQTLVQAGKCKDGLRATANQIEKKFFVQKIPFEKIKTKNGKSFLVKINANKSTRPFVLNAHYDRAPIDGAWDRPPFSGTITKSRIFGRGCADDIAGIVILFVILNILKKNIKTLTKSVVFHFVLGDEDTGEGTKALALRSKKPEGVVIVDGTWPSQIIIGHLGQLWIDLRIKGKPVAACSMKRGSNPLSQVPKLFNLLKKWNRQKTSSNRRRSKQNVPSSFLNIGCVRSGVWAGSVPADVTIKIQIGFSPPLTCTQVFDEIKELVKRKIKNAYISKGKLCRENFRNNSSCPLLESLKKIIRENCKTDPSCRIVSGHSDMGFYKCNNVIMYGPGAGWNAHGMNESYKLSDMPIVVNNLLELITGVNKRIK